MFNDVVLVLPTSGTTGPPKHVPLTQENIDASILAWQTALKLRSSDRCLNAMPIWHGALISNVMTSLHVGGRVLSIRDPSHDAMWEAIHQFQPTWLPLPRKLAQQVLGEECIYHPTGPLRFVRLSKASFTPKELVDLEQIFQCPVLQSYGMTEASSGPVSCETLECRRLGSVGKPQHLQVKIDRGEILLRGPSIMQGYINGPSDTFVFEWIGGERWFHTGDHGFFDDDGFLYLTQ